MIDTGQTCAEKHTLKWKIRLKCRWDALSAFCETW